jgi:hypothetical protein
MESNKIGLVKISDKLYLSNDEIAEDKELLKKNDITHIVSISGYDANDTDVMIFEISSLTWY